MPLTPEELYLQLVALVTEMPDLVNGPITMETHKWMGRACALVEQTGKNTNEMKEACQYLDVSRDRRAQIIIATVYEALAKAELKAPARVHGTFIAAGGTLDAYAAVGNVLGGAKASVLMVDPYADVKIVMEYAVLAPENVPIQVLADSDKKKHKATLKPAAERYEQQFRGSRAPLEVRLAPANTLHDRLIIVDHNSVLGRTPPLRGSRLGRPSD